MTCRKTEEAGGALGENPALSVGQLRHGVFDCINNRHKWKSVARLAG